MKKLNYFFIRQYILIISYKKAETNKNKCQLLKLKKNFFYFSHIFTAKKL